MNVQAAFDMMVSSSPTPSRTRRAFRRTAGRSGGIFERVPGSRNPYQFRYVKPEHQSRSPGQQLTCKETPTATTIDSPSDENSTIKAPTSDSVRQGASSIDLGNAEGSDTSSIASSALSEYTVASHEPRSKSIRRSMRNLRDHLRDSTISTSTEQFRRGWAQHMFRKQGPQTIGRAGMVEADGVQAADSETGRRESKFTEELGGDETESTVALLEESEKATWRFFGLERKAG